jgi:hypothetical protein
VTPNIHYEKRELVGERLELKRGPIYWLGPDLTLRDCTIIISAAGRSLVPMSGQFINCTIQAKGDLKTVRWAPISLRGGRFTGRFTGNDFGFREDLDERRTLGGIEDCDFSDSTFAILRTARGLRLTPLSTGEARWGAGRVSWRKEDAE